MDYFIQMKDDEIPCEICTWPTNINARRYGGKACGTCASFFARSIKDQASFKCVLGDHECLKIPSILGRGCRRCRFDRCLEIGMSTNGMPPKQNAPEPVQNVLPEVSIPAPPQIQQITPVPQAIQIPQAPQQIMTIEKAKEFAIKINILLETIWKFPFLLQTYMFDGNFGFLNLPQQNAISSKTLDFIIYLSMHFMKFPISEAELPILCIFCMCKFEFHQGVITLTPEDFAKIKEIQDAGFNNVFQKCTFIDKVRLFDLVILSAHVLNYFKSVFGL